MIEEKTNSCYYLTKFIDCYECNKDAPYECCCRLICGEMVFCDQCNFVFKPIDDEERVTPTTCLDCEEKETCTDFDYLTRKGGGVALNCRNYKHSKKKDMKEINIKNERCRLCIHKDTCKYLDEMNKVFDKIQSTISETENPFANEISFNIKCDKYTNDNYRNDFLTLSELRDVCNDLIEKYDPTTQILLEIHDNKVETCKKCVSVQRNLAAIKLSNQSIK